MKILKEIKDKKWPKDIQELKLREASRAVLFDENNLVPVLFVSQHNYHKIPGGGIKEGEDRIKGLVREVLEEVGSEVKITGEVGKTIEFRSKWDLKQISYCYVGKIVSKGEPDFTEKELSQGFQLLWVPLEEAISLIENDKPDDYEGWFIQKRDIVFLKEVFKTRV